MTILELKEEARKLGYKIVKYDKYVKLLRCKCGTKKSPTCVHYYERNEKGILVFRKAYRCLKCGLESGQAKSLQKAREEWNKAFNVNDLPKE